MIIPAAIFVDVVYMANLSVVDKKVLSTSMRHIMDICKVNSLRIPIIYTRTICCSMIFIYEETYGKNCA